MRGIYQYMYAHASVTLICLGLLSLVVLAIGLERLFFLHLYQRRLTQALKSILEALAQGDKVMARALNLSAPWHPAGYLLALVLGPETFTLGKIKRAQAQVLRSTKRGLWILGSSGSLAPFIGLFGTVLGIMEAFKAISAQGGGGFQVVSLGISEALTTTAAGIFVAIEAMLLFNYLQVRTLAYGVQLKEAVEEILESSAQESLKTQE